MVLDKIKTILAEQFKMDKSDIEVSALIQDDLGADSPDVVELLMTIEDEFSLEIPDEDIENIKTVGDLVSYIENNCK